MNNYRQDFPSLKEKVAFLDSAASSLKPYCVIKKIDEYYHEYAVNVDRSNYDMAYKATSEYEETREVVKQFINANRPEEIVFTRGTSNALNMISQMYAPYLKKDDEVIVSELEHHSSFLPWMKVCEKRQALLKYVPLTSELRITLANLKKVVTDKTKVIALTYVSNTMGYITPLKDIIAFAHSKNIIVVVDAAQAVGHFRVDVQDLDCDFLAFSGHKMFGPTGVGVLYGKYALLDKLEPVEFGGEMIDEVEKHHLTYQKPPHKFETGTMPIAEVIALKEAIKYVKSIGYDYLTLHTKELMTYLKEQMADVQGVTVYNKSVETGIMLFNIDGVHPHDAATVFNDYQVCLRAGHHCASLVMKRLKVNSTLRLSLHVYNNKEDIDQFINALKETRDFFLKF